jgi:hypothetical protein
MKLPLFGKLYYQSEQGNNKKFLIVVSVIAAILTVDTYISSFIDLIQDQMVSIWGILLLCLMASSYIVGQYMILSFVKQKSKEYTSHMSSFKFLFRVVASVQWSLAAIFVILILQLAITAHYSTIMLIAATAISNGLSIVLLGLLSLRFFSWYKLNKNSVIIITYTIASAIAAFSASITLTFSEGMLLLKPQEIGQQLQVIPNLDPGTTMAMIQEIFIYVGIASFISLWIGSVLLIRQHYSQRFGTKRYWIIVSLPLVYFLSYFVNEIIPSLSLSESQLMILYLLFPSMNLAGGVLFGVAFLKTARSIIPKSAVTDYMTIAACGLILLFVSSSGTVLHAPYPPFGFATVSFVGLSSYLLLLGLYASAISVSQDSKLRRSIKKSATDEGELIRGIGQAHMEQEIKKKVLDLAKADSERDREMTGVDPSLTDNDLRYYLDEVIKEKTHQRYAQQGERNDGSKSKGKRAPP